MDPLVYPRERTLATITLVLGILVWLLLVLGTLGVVLIYILLAFFAYVFAHSALIAWIKGTAVRLSEEQFPDLHQRLEACCRMLGIAELPDAYILNGSGALNAFATRFLGRNFVVLLSDVVDAMEADPDGVNFYIGHELGHLRMKHLTGRLWRLPVLWLPLLGGAYSRAKEYTCDRHGRACCPSPHSAAHALVALAAGPRRWQSANLESYVAQMRANAGFWASFHELIGGYPWLTKRVARTLDPSAAVPPRNPLAYVLALFVPFGGRGAGGAAGVMVTVAIIGILAAVALPAYQDYTVRAKAAQTWMEGAATRQALENFYAERKQVPPSLASVGVPDSLPGGAALGYDSKSMTVTVRTANGELLMQPRPAPDAATGIAWYCLPGPGMRPAALPASCRPPQ